MEKYFKIFVVISLSLLLGACNSANDMVKWNKNTRHFDLINESGKVWLTNGRISIVLKDGTRISSDELRFSEEVKKKGEQTIIGFSDSQKQLDMELTVKCLDSKSAIIDLIIRNCSNHPLYLDRIEMLTGHLMGRDKTEKVKILLGGASRDRPIQTLHKDINTPSSFTIAIQSPPLAAGFLEGKKNFNHFTVSDSSGVLCLTAWGECNGCMLPAGAARTTDPLFLSVHENSLQQMERFADLAAEMNHVKLWQHNRAVWCNWYAGWIRKKVYTYKQGLVKGVEQNIPYINKYFFKRGAKTMRICDDFIYYGDWYDTTKAIPKGYTHLAKMITDAGLIAGVWYPTYWASTGSEIFKEHPEWFALNKDGSIYKNTNEFQNRSRLDEPHVFVIFDSSLPEVQDYFEKVARMWRERGFRYVTNDFLASATHPPRYHDPTFTKAEVLRKGMEVVRRGLGDDVFYRTIGGSFGTCMGLSNDVRISGDSHGDKPFAYHRTGAVWFYNHRVWFNDPSAIVFMRYGEVKDITWNTMWVSWIALAGTVMTYGEVLDELPEKYINVYKRVFPPLNIPGRPLDLWENDPYLLWGIVPGEADGSYELFGIFDLDGKGKRHVELNLDEISARSRGWDKPKKAPREYLLWDFWQQKLVKGDGAKLRIPMPSKSCRLFALRAKLARPQLLGTSGHFTQGSLETKDIRWDGNKSILSGKVHGNGSEETTLFFHVPDGMTFKGAALDGKSYETSTPEPNVIALDVLATSNFMDFSLTFSGKAKGGSGTRPFVQGRAATRYSSTEQRQLYIQNYFADDGEGNVFYRINQPRGKYYKGKTYIAYQGPNLDPYVICYDHHSGTWSGAVKAGENPLINDSHGNPALLVEQSGYVHIFYGCHGGPMKYVKSTKAGDISSWTAMPDPAIHATYPQLIQMPDGTIYLFYRRGGHTADWVYRTSTDDGAIWSGETVVIDSNPNDVWYPFFKKAPNSTIHAGFCWKDEKHPRGGETWQRFNIYYMFRDFDGNWKNASGKMLSIPVTKSVLDTFALVYNSGTDHAENPSIDIDLNNIPYLVFTTGSGKSYKHVFAKWNGQSWFLTDIAKTDHLFDDPAIIVHSATHIEVFLCREGTNGTGNGDGDMTDRGGNVEKWTTFDGGTSWSKVADIITKDATGDVYAAISVLEDFHPDAKIAFYDFSKLSLPGRKVYIWGNSGFLRNRPN